MPLSHLSVANKLLALLLLTTSQIGCAATDAFRDRAAQYNEQTADIKRSLVITNIIRSSYTLPLQFTDISTVTGQAQAQGSINSSVPFNLLPPTTLLGSVAPGGNLSANSTFGVTNLNTQEFYQGIQEPIQKELLAFYVRSGFPLEVLLPLIISEIEIVDRGRRVKLVNDPLRPRSFQVFNSAISVLIAKGLSAESRSSIEKFGPILSPSKAANPRLLSQVLNGGTDVPRLSAVSGGFQIQKASRSAQFCFDPAKVEAGPLVEAGVTSVSTNLRGRKLRIPFVTANGESFGDADIEFGADKFCGFQNDDKKSDAPQNSSAKQDITPNLTVKLRSVEGIFSYLGEIVRMELGLAGRPPTAMDLISFNDGSTYRLFHLEQRAPGIGELGVDYLGVPYALTIDPTGRDASSRVLQLITDLLALKSSAKNLPSPSVVSIIGR